METIPTHQPADKVWPSPILRLPSLAEVFNLTAFLNPLYLTPFHQSWKQQRIQQLEEIVNHQQQHSEDEKKEEISPSSSSPNPPSSSLLNPVYHPELDQLTYDLTLDAILLHSPDRSTYLNFATLLSTASHFQLIKQQRLMKEQWMEYGQDPITRLALLKSSYIHLLLSLSSVSSTNFSSLVRYSIFINYHSLYYHQLLLLLIKQEETQQHLQHKQQHRGCVGTIKSWFSAQSPDSKRLAQAKTQVLAFWSHSESDSDPQQTASFSQLQSLYLPYYRHLLYKLLSLPNQAGTTYTIHMMKDDSMETVPIYNPSADLILTISNKQPILHYFAAIYGISQVTATLLYLTILLINPSCTIDYMTQLEEEVRKMVEIGKEQGMLLTDEKNAEIVFEDVCRWCIMIISQHKRMTQEFSIENPTMELDIKQEEVKEEKKESGEEEKKKDEEKLEQMASSIPTVFPESGVPIPTLNIALSLFNIAWSWLEQHVPLSASSSSISPSLPHKLRLPYFHQIMTEVYSQRYQLLVKSLGEQIHPSRESMPLEASLPSSPRSIYSHAFLTSASQIEQLLNLFRQDIEEEKQLTPSLASIIPELTILPSWQSAVYLEQLQLTLQQSLPQILANDESTQLLTQYFALAEFVSQFSSDSSVTPTIQSAIRSLFAPSLKALIPPIVNAIEQSPTALTFNSSDSSLLSLTQYIDEELAKVVSLPLSPGDEIKLTCAFFVVLNRWMLSRSSTTANAPASSSSSQSFPALLTLINRLQDYDQCFIKASSILLMLHINQQPGLPAILSLLHISSFFEQIQAISSQLTTDTNFLTIISTIVKERPVDVMWDKDRTAASLSPALTPMIKQLHSLPTSTSNALAAIICESILVSCCQAIEAICRDVLNNKQWEDQWSGAQLDRMKSMIYYLHSSLTTFAALMPPIPSHISPSSSSTTMTNTGATSIVDESKSFISTPISPSFLSSFPIPYHSWIAQQSKIVNDTIALLTLLMAPSSQLIGLYTTAALQSSQQKDPLASLRLSMQTLYEVLLSRGRRDHDAAAAEFIKVTRRPR